MTPDVYSHAQDRTGKAMLIEESVSPKPLTDAGNEIWDPKWTPANRRAMQLIAKEWWAVAGSNRGPPACKASDLVFGAVPFVSID